MEGSSTPFHTSSPLPSFSLKVPAPAASSHPCSRGSTVDTVTRSSLDSPLPSSLDSSFPAPACSDPCLVVGVDLLQPALDSSFSYLLDFAESQQSPISLGSAENMAMHISQSEETRSYSTQPEGSRGRGRRKGGCGCGGRKGGRGQVVHDVDSESSDEQEPVARQIWRADDETLLVSAWLNTSKDIIVNTEQKSKVFWKRVKNYYNEFKPPNQQPRTKKECESKWTRINYAVSNFVGQYEKALAMRASGESEEYVLNKARTFFYKLLGYRFTEDHCWQILRNEPKWSDCYLETISRSKQSSGIGSSKRSRVDTEGHTFGLDTLMSSFNVDHIQRPTGIKLAKRGRWKGASSSSHTLNEDIELSRRMTEAYLEQQKNMHVYKMEQLRIKTEEIRERKLENYMKLLYEEYLTPEKEQLKQILRRELGME